MPVLIYNTVLIPLLVRTIPTTLFYTCTSTKLYDTTLILIPLPRYMISHLYLYQYLSTQQHIYTFTGT